MSRRPLQLPVDRRSWTSRVEAALDRRFAHAPLQRAHYGSIWQDFLNSGLADAELVSGLAGTSYTQFRQRMWEILLARHLRACGHALTRRPEGQPDFRFEVDGRVVWVEAISPTPGQDLPESWTTVFPTPGEFIVGGTPNTEMALRWTAAFKEKAEKCREYRAKGVVGPDDAFVLAIDGSQLSKFPDTHGISQLPFVVEAVFAVGPITIEVDAETGKLGNSFQSVEASIINRNAAHVPKERFFSPEFAGVSAVLGCSPSPHASPMLPVQIAYNPLAQAPLAPGYLGHGAEEWFAAPVYSTEEFQDWELRSV